MEIAAVLVRNHGPFAWGKSGAKAVETAQALEIIADMALKSLSLDGQAPAAPEYLLAKALPAETWQRCLLRPDKASVNVGMVTGIRLYLSELAGSLAGKKPGGFTFLDNR